jgi:glycosyltransferase involved in cell wall biosynthesis
MAAESDARPADRPKLLYVCFERLRPSTAAATHVHEICRGLEKRGFSVSLIAEEAGPAPGWTERCCRYARVLRRGLRLAARNDILFVRAHFAALPLALFARLIGIPTAHEVNGLYEDAFITHPRLAPFRHWLSWMQRLQYRWSDALVAVTPDLVAWARRQAGHDKVFLVSNAANTTIFNPDGPSLGRERRFVVFFGGLVRWHGIEIMLEAVRCRAWPSEVELLLIGPVVDESLRPVLDRLPRGASYLGQVAQSELPPLIRGAIAALVPILDPAGRSSQGVMPLKMFEALACGTPVIASDLPGQADFVRANRCGIVVPVADSARLAEAVAELAADPARAARLGRSGAKTVLAGHSWEARSAELADILRRTLDALARAKADLPLRPPWYLTLRGCLVIAAAGVAVGLALRLARPVQPPEPGLLARIETWKALAAELQRNHRR